MYALTVLLRRWCLLQTNLIVAGVGGQGVITAGFMIAETMSVMGKNVVMSEIHGLAQRGGAVTVEIRVGDVYSPIIPKGRADIILGFEPIETIRAADKANPETFILMNSEKQTPVSLSMEGREYLPDDDISRLLKPFKHVVKINATGLALEAGNTRTINTVMVGAAIATSVLPITPGELKLTLRKRFNKSLYDVNERALNLGINYVKNDIIQNDDGEIKNLHS